MTLLWGILTFPFVAKGQTLPAKSLPGKLAAPSKTNLRPDTIPRSPILPLPMDSTKGLKDSTQKSTDSMVQRIDTIRMSKDSIDAPIHYAAEDSGIMVIPTKEFLLYGKAKVNYTDLKLEAATIQFDQGSQLVKAYGALDTTGNPLSKPQFTQGEMKSVSDSIFFNMKTGKGLTKNSFFQEGEIYVNARDLKKISKDEVFASRALFTTCNLDVPHYHFRTSKMKIINNKLGIAGPSFPEFEGVPMPIGIPFGIFPLSRGRHSGILPPAFTASPDFGLGLEGLGYYKVLNDNIDATVRSNIYSFGGWMVNLNSKYLKRYAYTGNFNLTMQRTRSLNNTAGAKEEFNDARSFMINWTHSRDSRARPGTSFSANVNFGSSRFNQNVLNNPFVNFQNNLSSSISYSKDWKGKYNLSLNFNHSQNNNLRLVNLTLPTVNFNVVTFYPFQKKEAVGSPKWYEKIGVGYSGNLQNQIAFYDTAFNFRRLLDTMQYGAQHNIPITLSLPSLGPITVAPGMSYQETWYGQRIVRTWDSSASKVDTTIQRGFFAARQMSFNLGFNTRIFGTYRYGPNSKVLALRHEIRPSISLYYQPDLVSRYYSRVQVDTSGRTINVSGFEGGLYSVYAPGQNGGISFGIDNLLEMKTRNKKDTADKAGKKVRLLDGFGFNSGYNFLQDSFQLQNFTFYARSTLFEKVNITAGALLNPYGVDSLGYPVNKLVFDPARFKFGRLVSGNLAISTSFSSKRKDGKKAQDRNLPTDPFMTPDEQMRQLQFARANPAEFTDFNIPWNINLSYSLTFSRVLKPDYSGFTTQTFSSLNFNGDFNLTPKWKVGAMGFYDVSNNRLTQLSTFITREMHCWQLSINVNPVGIFRSFNITINPKSGILRDLRINRARSFTTQQF
ncbi:MAG: LPS-assembly protein LptD [Sphingobacteriia bacterium]|nr:MAG: LPS-assembly protein LptD [Sphingobacteriia bacterium]